MKHALLRECRDILLQIRTLKHDELDPSVTAELDLVIAKMTLLGCPSNILDTHLVVE